MINMQIIMQGVKSFIKFVRLYTPFYGMSSHNYYPLPIETILQNFWKLLLTSEKVCDTMDNALLWYVVAILWQYILIIRHF